MPRAKFFCENCKREVKPNARVCPHCGRFFTAVKCPACGFTGEGRFFTEGCPSCGYSGVSGIASTAQPRRRLGSGDETYNVDEVEGESRARSYTPTEKPATPSWVFPLALLILAGAFIVLVILYLSL